jgi:hypothetical protein
MFTQVDNIIYAFQICLIISTLIFRCHGRLDLILVFALLSILVISPSSVVMVAGLGEDYSGTLGWRQFIYSYKIFEIGSSGAGTVYFLLTAGLVYGILRSLKISSLSKHGQQALLLLVLLYLMGFFSVFLNVYVVEIPNLVYAAREFETVVAGFLLGAIISKTNNLGLFKKLVTNECTLIATLGSISFLFVADSVGWERDFGLKNILPSQTYPLLAYINLLAIGKGRISVFAVILRLIPFGLCVVSGNKESLVMGFACLFFGVVKTSVWHLFSIDILRKPILLACVLIIAVWISYLLPIYFSSLLENGMPSLVVRYYQIVNSIKTIFNNGVAVLLFGIGWGQWYLIYEPFPFIDYMSGPRFEVEERVARFMISVPAVPVLRSIGLIGFGYLFVSLVYIFKMVLERSSVHWFWGVFVVLVCALSLSSAISGNVEYLFCCSCFLGSYFKSR